MSVVPGFASTGGPWLAGASALAALGYASAVLRPRPGWGGPLLLGAWLAQAAALLVHALGLGLSDPGMRFGFAPALSLTVWLVIAVYAVESRLLPLPALRRGLAGLGVLSVLLAWAVPGDLRPGLSSPWAPLHWLTGLVAYGLFAIAVLHGMLTRRAERALRRHAGPATVGGLPLLRLEKLTFHFVAAGFALLTLTLVFGVAFTAWRWDHKTIFSMLAWAVFAGLLIGRHTLGWRGRIALRWLHGGALLLLLAYAGSRFVSEVLLHRTAGA